MRNENVDAGSGDMDEGLLECQLEVFEERMVLGYRSYETGDEVGDSSGESCLVVGRTEDIAGVVPGFGVFGSAGKDTGL